MRNFRATVERIQPDVVIMVFGASFLSENEIAPGEWHAPCTAPFDNWFKDQIRKSVESLSSTGATVYWATIAYYRAEITERTPMFDDQIDCENVAARRGCRREQRRDGIDRAWRMDVPDTRVPCSNATATNCDQTRRTYLDEGGSLVNIWMLSQIFNPPPWTRLS